MAWHHQSAVLVRRILTKYTRGEQSNEGRKYPQHSGHYVATVESHHVVTSVVTVESDP